MTCHAILLFCSVFLSLAARTETPSPATGPLVHEALLEAPVAEVWEVFSTGDGFRKLGPAQAEIELSIDGRIRSHYDAQGALGDDGTIENRILAFEPERMISFRIERAPKGFPFPEASKRTWSVVTLTALAARRTHVRLAMLGWDASPESQKMRAFFDAGNAWTLKKLASVWDTGAAPDPAAPPHAADPLAPVVLEATVAAPRADVWRAWTTSAGWKQFFGAEARIGARPGEPFEILFDPSAPPGERGAEGCTVLSSVPGEMFSFTWNAPPKFARARAERTWVVVELEPLSAGATRVRLSHLGFAEQAAAHAGAEQEWREVRAYFSQAWPRVLGALRAHFSPGPEGGSPPAK